jgi:molybdopterin-guanine dinucleotide biosynthesis protein A
MGTEKALLELGSETLIETVIHRLESLFDNVIVATAKGNSFPELGLTEVSDIYRGCGSLGGLHAGLTAADSDYVFAVACDMPLVSTALVRRMISLSEEFDVVVPRIQAEHADKRESEEMWFEPLHAVYGKACIPYMENLLEQRNLRIFDFFSQAKVRFVDTDEIRAVDPDMLSFFNINTPADLERARGLILEGNSRKGNCAEKHEQPR